MAEFSTNWEELKTKMIDPSGGGGHQKGLAIRNNCLEEAEAEEEQQDKKKFG